MTAIPRLLTLIAWSLAALVACSESTDPPAEDRGTDAEDVRDISSTDDGDAVSDDDVDALSPDGDEPDDTGGDDARDVTADADVAPSDTDAEAGPADVGDVPDVEDAADTGDEDIAIDADAPSDVSSDTDADAEDTAADDAVDGDAADVTDDAAPDVHDATDTSRDPEVVDDAPPPIGALGFRFRRVEIDEFRLYYSQDLTAGIAGGDFDGDGRIDLFITRAGFEGSDPGRSCIFFNRSTPDGGVVLERHSGACIDDAPRTATALDLDGDGVDELVTTHARARSGIIRTRRWDAASEELVSAAGSLLLPDGHCPGFIPHDIDLDGDGDLLIGCVSSARAAVWDDGGWSLRDGGYVPLDQPGFIFGLGVLDVDHDGLLDVIRFNDTGSIPGRRNIGRNPGGIYRRCVPGDGCEYRDPRWEFGEGELLYGAFMGLGTVQVPAFGELLYLTDIGANRANRYGDDGFVSDVATELGIGVASVAIGRWVTSWSALTYDFDGNELDDLFVSNSPILQEILTNPDLFAWEDHFDVVLLQSDERTEFDVLASEVGLLPNDSRDSLASRQYSPRGALKTDLDHDGHIEITEAAVEGRPRMYEVDRGTRRGCRILPESRYVFAHGYGYAVAYDHSPDVWRRWDLQGQPYVTTPDLVLTSETQGTFRFPSGWTTRFACSADDEFTVALEEPDWIHVDATGDGGALVAFDIPVETLAVRARLATGEIASLDPVATDDGTWSVPSSEPLDALLLQHDGWWVARWIPVD